MIIEKKYKLINELNKNSIWIKIRYFSLCATEFGINIRKLTLIFLTVIRKPINNPQVYFIQNCVKAENIKTSQRFRLLNPFRRL